MMTSSRRRLPNQQEPESTIASHIVRQQSAVTTGRPASDGMTIWLTGLSGAGKTTVGRELERRLVEAGRLAYLLDGDDLRLGINAGLGFSASGRKENVRRAGEVARLFADAGVAAVVSMISPFAEDRGRVRSCHVESGLRFVEVFVDTPLRVCAARDPKGLYAKARRGDIRDFTGVDSPYERPTHPDIVLRPTDGDAAAQATAIFRWLYR